MNPSAYGLYTPLRPFRYTPLPSSSQGSGEKQGVKTLDSKVFSNICALPRYSCGLWPARVLEEDNDHCRNSPPVTDVNKNHCALLLVVNLASQW